MKNCEAMTSSTHSFAYSYRLLKKCFDENYENSKFHIVLIFLSALHQIVTVLFKFVTLSIDLKGKFSSGTEF